MSKATFGHPCILLIYLLIEFSMTHKSNQVLLYQKFEYTKYKKPEKTEHDQIEYDIRRIWQYIFFQSILKEFSTDQLFSLFKFGIILMLLLKDVLRLQIVMKASIIPYTHYSIVVTQAFGIY